jgi:hypothetical protein
MSRRKHFRRNIVAARDATAKALAECEQGWIRAQEVIAARAGLSKGLDGILA